MEGPPTSGWPASKFDSLLQPFRLLGTDPAATPAQIEAAFTRALGQNAATTEAVAAQVASAEALVAARDAVLDPARRLPSELTFPLDSTPAQLASHDAALSGTASPEELLQLAAGLPPLSRANLLAHLASRAPAESALLTALLDAHVALDVSEIYASLRTQRSRAAFAAPSLVSVSDGLTALLAEHAEAALAGYGNAEAAAGPVLECAQAVRDSGDRYRIEALSVLLGAYRQAVAAPRAGEARRIEAACEAVQTRPDDVRALGQLADALRDWAMLCAPLLVLEADLARPDPETELAIVQVRALLAHLGVHHHYATATKAVGFARDAFAAVPGAAAQFDEAAELLRKLSCEAAIKPLRELIEQFGADAAALVKAVEKDGFGKKSAPPARALWQAFEVGVTATAASEFADQPWMLTRHLALRLGNEAASAAAACRLITGLMRHGEKVAADPATLETLRDDLGHVERMHPRQAAAARAGVLGKIVKWTALGLVVIAIGLFGAYRYFGPAPLYWLFPSLAPSPFITAGPEIPPPVGKGQHFDQHFVRYCHFQEERLRVIKEKVDGPQDFRAYNVLVTDYNSRCSDFFYLDKDIRIVTEEVEVNKAALEAEAMKIMASWPWRAAADKPAEDKAAPPAVK